MNRIKVLAGDIAARLGHERPCSAFWGLLQNSSEGSQFWYVCCNACDAGFPCGSESKARSLAERHACRHRIGVIRQDLMSGEVLPRRGSEG